MFPERPTCHDGNYFAEQFGPSSWKEQDRHDTGQVFRHCSYCGSLHPEDLLKIFELGGYLQGADWKYGWPHKYYVEVPNPIAGQTVKIGSRSEMENGVRIETPIMGTAGNTYSLKFYNEHLKDLIGQPEFAEVAKAIYEHFDGQYYPRVAFIEGKDGGLGYVTVGSARTESYEDLVEWYLKKGKGVNDQ